MSDSEGTEPGQQSIACNCGSLKLYPPSTIHAASDPKPALPNKGFSKAIQKKGQKTFIPIYLFSIDIDIKNWMSIKSHCCHLLKEETD